MDRCTVLAVGVWCGVIFVSGLLIGRMTTERTLEGWIAAAERQQNEAVAAEQKRAKGISDGYRRTADSWRAQWLAGLRPRIPRAAASLPASAAASATAGVDAAASDALPAGPAADRLIQDCAMTTLQLQSLQEWAKP